MESNFLFPTGIALLLLWSGTMIGSHPYYIFIIGLALILAGFVLAYFKFVNKPTPFNLFRKFRIDKHKEGENLLKAAFPYIKFHKWARLLRFFHYKHKSPSPEKLREIKRLYDKWRMNLFNGTNFSLKKPTASNDFPISTLFEEVIKDDAEWGYQLIKDIGAVKFLKEVKSINFSEQFKKEPEILNESWGQTLIDKYLFFN